MFANFKPKFLAGVITFKLMTFSSVQGLNKRPKARTCVPVVPGVQGEKLVSIYFNGKRDAETSNPVIIITRD